MKVWPNHSRGAWQLYGHSHGNLPDDPISLSMDVGVDSHDFVPLHFDEIQAVLKVKAEAKAAHIAKRSAALKSADSPESRELLDRARAFERYIGIDYSGAEKPIASLKGLRVYMAHRDTPPVEVQPPACAKKYWTRRGIAEWLAKVLSQDIPTLGIDHGFSFPLRYFTEHGLTFDWRAFLDDF